MAQFKPIFTLNVAHAFFVDGRCTQLRFVPTAATERLLRRYQLLIRHNDTGFTLVADTDHWIAPDDESVLRFNAIAQDKSFGFYTAESAGSLTPLYASSKNITADNSTLVLQRDVPPQLPGEDSTRTKPGVQLPAVIIDIDLNDIAGSDFIAEEAVTRWIRFTTRDIYWKYYFFGDLAKLELDIHDVSSSQGIGFYQSDEPVAKNGKAFISHEPIAMNSEPAQRFQLKDKNNSGKILIKRLPSAGIHLISKSRNLNGQQILVAEIYVNQ